MLLQRVTSVEARPVYSEAFGAAKLEIYAPRDERRYPNSDAFLTKRNFLSTYALLKYPAYIHNSFLEMIACFSEVNSQNNFGHLVKLFLERRQKAQLFD